jgi:hypothetical protein
MLINLAELFFEIVPAEFLSDDLPLRIDEEVLGNGLNANIRSVGDRRAPAPSTPPVQTA